jgi:signal transduction histidine kinase
MVGGALGPVPTPMQKLMNVAKDNAERLATLVNDILDFEKLEYGGMLFQKEPHSLFKLVQSAMDSNQGYADKFSIRLVLLANADPQCQVLTDANRLLQVLSNLISNAIKFSHPQGQVEVNVETSARHARVWVIDHGIGISSAFQKQIFGKFSQEDGSGQRKYAGTGLGLSLSKAMIEKLGGTIGFDSVEGQGSRFYIELPLTARANIAPGEPNETSKP